MFFAAFSGKLAVLMTKKPTLQNINQKITQFLKPGDLFTSAEPAIYKTILGSCISVCIHDRIRKSGGMNHFIYADSNSLKNINTYGDISTENLIQEMISRGSRKENLIVKLYGGSSIGSSKAIYNPGKKNIEMARKKLREWNIPIISEDTGGCYGRTIIFNTFTNEIHVKLLSNCLKNCLDGEPCT